MSFFLLGKTGSHRPYLISEIAFQTRSDALAELSHITGEPSFASWDDEMFIVDDQACAPVLIVRPAPAAPVDETEAGADVAEERFSPGADVSAGSVPEAPVESLKHALLRTTVQLESEGIAAPESVGPSLVGVELSDEEEFVAEEVDAAPAADEAAAEPSMGALADDADVVSDEVSDFVLPSDEAESVPEGGFVLPIEPEPLDAEQGDLAPEAEADTASEAEEPSVDDTGSLEPTVSAAQDVAPAAWPWDSVEGAGSVDLSGLEEAGDDVGSLVRAAGDDETMASAAHTMIMGDYADETTASQDEAPVVGESPAQEFEPAAEDEPGVTPQDEPELEELIIIVEPMGAADVSEDIEAVSAPDVDQDPTGLEATASAPEGFDEDVASLVAELAAETAVTAPAPEPARAPFVIDATSDYVDLTPAPQPAEDSPSIDVMTCNDCVYVETCPNRGQRLPASCGSFQWK